MTPEEIIYWFNSTQINDLRTLFKINNTRFNTPTPDNLENNNHINNETLQKKKKLTSRLLYF